MRILIFLVTSLLVLNPSPLFSQFFGKNKVQYKDFDWRIIKTENFDVFYYPSEARVAMDAARMAERSYAYISNVLSHDVKQPIPLILYASHTDFQQTNITLTLVDEGVGGLTELFKSRVVIPFTGSYAEFEHVLTHEIIHAFQFDILYGRGVQSLIGNPFVFQPPLWFSEGMAEYISSGMDNHTSMWMRDAALGGYLISIQEMNYVGDIRAYRFGQSIWSYVAGRYGDEKVGEILQKAPRFKSIEKAFKSSLGIDLEELSEEWMEDVRKTYLPKIAEHDKLKDFSKQLTHHGKDLSSFNLSPAISPSGDRIAYICNKDLYADIYLSSTSDGKIIKKLVEGERSGSFESLRFLSATISWSPDEKYVAFVAKVGKEDAIYIKDVDRGKIFKKLIFGLDGILSPSWSPDGNSLVFVGLQGGQSDIYTASINGEDFQPLTSDKFTDRDPQWSPDGESIAFTTDRGSVTNFGTLLFGPFNIAIYHLRTGEIELLTHGEGKNINPVWSPDGGTLAFLSDRTGVTNIFALDLELRKLYQLTDILTGISGIIPSSPAISWSRSGDRIAFSAFNDAGWDIFLIKDPMHMKKLYVAPLPEADENVDEVVLARKKREADEKPEDETDLAVSPLMQEDRKDFFTSGVDPLESWEVGTYSPYEEKLISFLPDTSSFELTEYSIRFTPDYLSGGAAFATNVGFAGQTQMAFSDILGNHNIQITAGLYSSIQDSDIFANYWYLRKRTNVGVGFFQFRNNYYIFQPQQGASDEIVSQTYRGFEVLFSRPFNKFDRLDFGLQGVFISEDIFSQDFFYSSLFYATDQEKYSYLVPYVSLVTDNILWGYTGPISGRRGRISYQHALSPLGSGISFQTLMGDYRRYLNYRQRYVLAWRVIGAFSWGDNPQILRLGGGNTLRGLEYGELWGNKLVLMNLEFRYPLIRALAMGWPLPITFREIGGVFFLDIGGAWRSNDDFHPFSSDATFLKLDDLIASYGFGARINLGWFVLRYDLAQKTDFTRNIGSARSYFTIGAEY
jgi:Tol biopolymer transport system component